MKICLSHFIVVLLLLPVSSRAQKFGKTDIEKYKVALKINPNDTLANYQMAMALDEMGKGSKALSYLKRVYQSKNASAKLVTEAYNLAGKILVVDGKPKKAVKTYEEGIQASKAKSDYVYPGYQRLHYNLSLAYYQTKRFNRAEVYSSVAIFFDTSHVDSHWSYALATLREKKAGPALLGFCSFILLSTEADQNKEAYDNIVKIIQDQQLLKISDKENRNPDNETIKLNNAIRDTLKIFETKRFASSEDLFAAQLKAIFIILEKNAAWEHWGDMFKDQFVDYFYKLSQTEHMPAFARFVSMHKPESIAWAKTHPQEMQALGYWIKNTPRWVLPYNK